MLNPVGKVNDEVGMCDEELQFAMLTRHVSWTQYVLNYFGIYILPNVVLGTQPHTSTLYHCQQDIVFISLDYLC